MLQEIVFEFSLSAILDLSSSWLARIWFGVADDDLALGVIS
jgi:hypothetical protein